MNLWRLVPQVSKPWNPAYRDVWEAMTPRERQGSCLFDMALLIVGVAVILLLSGCNDAGGPREKGIRQHEIVFNTTYSVVNKTCDRYGRAIYVAQRSAPAMALVVIPDAPECKK